MTDIAKLGYEVDSDPLRRAADRLDRMGREADTAERKTQRASSGMSKALGRVLKNTNALLSRFRLIAAAAGAAGAAVMALSEQIVAVGAGAAGIAVSVALEPMVRRLRSAADNAAELARNIKTVFAIANRSGLSVFGLGAGVAQGIAAGMDPRTISNLATAMAAFGLRSDETSDALGKFVDITKSGQATVTDLIGALEFANDPWAVLSRAIGVNRATLERWEAEGRTIQGALDNIGAELAQSADRAETVSTAWNRMTNAFAMLMRSFNQSGAMRAVIDLLNDITDWLRSGEANRLLQQLAMDFIHFARVTLPNFVKFVRTNWDTIVQVFQVAIGVLIGGAAGGVWGALIGAIIGGSSTIQGALGQLVGVFTGDMGAVEKELNENKSAVIDWGDVLIRVVGTVVTGVRAGFTAIGGVLKAVGITLGAAAAKAQALVTGEMERAQTISEMWAQDMGEIFDNVGGKLSKFRDQLATLTGVGGTDGSGGAAGKSVEAAASQAIARSTPTPEPFSGFGFDPDFSTTLPSGSTSGGSSGLSSGQQRLRNAQRNHQAARERFMNRTKEDLGALNQFAVAAARGVQGAFEQFFFKPFEGGLKGLVDSFATMLQRIAAQVAASQVANALFGKGFATGKSTDVGGWIGMALGAVLHDGGVVGRDGGSRVVPAAAFQGAERYHDGGFPGLARNEVPAILERGERVLTKEEQRGGARGTVVNMNVMTPDAQSFRQSRAQIRRDVQIAVT